MEWIVLLMLTSIVAYNCFMIAALLDRVALLEELQSVKNTKMLENIEKKKVK